MISLTRSTDGTWRCSDASGLRQWRLESAPDLGWRQVDAFLAHRYKHLGDPTDVEKAWAALGEARITRMLKGCLDTVSEGKAWKEPAGLPPGGLAPVLRWVLPATMRVNGEPGLAPAPDRKVAVGHSELILAVMTNRGAPPAVQQTFTRLGQELARFGCRVVIGASGPAEQSLLRGMGNEGLSRAQVILMDEQPQPAIPGLKAKRLSDFPTILTEAQARLAEWFPAWRGDEEETRALIRDLALLLSADHVIAWSSEGKEEGRLALPLLAAHQQDIPVINLGSSGMGLDRVLARLREWNEAAGATAERRQDPR